MKRAIAVLIATVMILSGFSVLSFADGEPTDEEIQAAKEAEKQAIAEAKEAEKAEKEAAKEQAKADKARECAIKSVVNPVLGTIGRELGKSIGGKTGSKFGKTLGGNTGASLARGLFGTLFKK